MCNEHYLSPCFKLIKNNGNSCLHAEPNTPVSSVKYMKPC